MYFVKPKDPMKEDKKDPFSWHIDHDKLREDAIPAIYKKKKSYTDEKGMQVFEYTKFHKDTNWWNLEKLFRVEELGDSYLYLREKRGFKTYRDDHGLIIHKNGRWNCCTVLPYIEYRIVKVTAVKVNSYEGSYHNYDVTVHLELPIGEAIKYWWKDSNLRRTCRAFLGVFIGIKKGIVRGWEAGWYNDLRRL